MIVLRPTARLRVGGRAAVRGPRYPDRQGLPLGEEPPRLAGWVWTLHHVLLQLLHLLWGEGGQQVVQVRILAHLPPRAGQASDLSAGHGGRDSGR